MTPETYMKRFHDPDCTGGDSSLTADALFPCREEQAERDCRCLTEPDEDDCCCKQSMAEALRLLGSTELGDLVDFNAFFFLTDTLAIGSTLFIPHKPMAPLTTSPTPTPPSAASPPATATCWRWRPPPTTTPPPPRPPP